MNDNKKKKSSKQRRVLIASIILAGVIAIGGTFAWFGASDEVTNKLTATSNFGVTIPEEFTPPQNWVPGQKVDKKVGLTNTGNVDAYARISLSNFIDITTKAKGVDLIDGTTEDESARLKTRTRLNKYNKFDDAVELYTDRNESTPVNGQVKSEDEVMSIQAGGRLVYAPFYDNSQISDSADSGRVSPQDIHIINSNKDQIKGDTFNPQNYIEVDNDGNVTSIKEADLKALVGSYTDTSADGTSTAFYPLVATSNGKANPTYYDVMSGLYVWERSTEATKTTDETGTTVTYEYTYAAYYYDALTNKYYAVDLTDGTTAGDGTEITATETSAKTTYDTTKSTYTVYRDGKSWGSGSDSVTNDQTSIITSLQAKLVQTKTLQAEDLTFDYTNIKNNTDPYIIAKYDPTPNRPNNGDDVKIKIYLYEKFVKTEGGNIKDGDVVSSTELTPNNATKGAGCWTLYNYLDNGKNVPYFYYNYILAEGTSVPDEHRLIKAVELDSTTRSDAYISFDYNLNVSADSVQVVPDGSGNILYKLNDSDNLTIGSAKAVNDEWKDSPATSLGLIVYQVQNGIGFKSGDNVINADGSLGKYRVTWTKQT